MRASKTTVRVLGFLILVACAAAAGVGIWYARGGGIRQAEVEDEDDDDDDEDEDASDIRPDGGVPRRPKKKPGRRQDKSGVKRRAGRPATIGPSGMSYEVAIAGNNLKLAPGTKATADLTDAQLAGPMRNATFLNTCGVPSSTHVTVKVAIRNGHAVGVSVYATPQSAATGCVERQVRGLHWPSSAKMDSFVTTY